MKLFTLVKREKQEPMNIVSCAEKELAYEMTRGKEYKRQALKADFLIIVCWISNKTDTRACLPDFIPEFLQSYGSVGKII